MNTDYHVTVAPAQIGADTARHPALTSGGAGGVEMTSVRDDARQMMYAMVTWQRRMGSGHPVIMMGIDGTRDHGGEGYLRRSPP